MVFIVEVEKTEKEKEYLITVTSPYKDKIVVSENFPAHDTEELVERANEISNGFETPHSSVVRSYEFLSCDDSPRMNVQSLRFELDFDEVKRGLLWALPNADSPTCGLYFRGLWLLLHIGAPTLVFQKFYLAVLLH